MSGNETDREVDVPGVVSGTPGGADTPVVGDVEVYMATGSRDVRRFTLTEPQAMKVTTLVQFGTSQAVSGVLDEHSERGSRDGRVDWKVTTGKCGGKFTVLDVGQKGDRLGDHFSFTVRMDGPSSCVVTNLSDCTEDKVRAFLAGVRDIGYVE